MSVVSLTHILHFFDDFAMSNKTVYGKDTGDAFHRVGTIESEEFANNILRNFREFGIKQVTSNKII